MATNAFIGRAAEPTDQALTEVLGPVKQFWDQLLDIFRDEHGAGIREWNSYSLKTGWSLRVKRKKRTLVWLGPAQGCFNVAFVLGEKAMKVVRPSDFPFSFQEILKKAPTYPEGTGIRFEVHSEKDLDVVFKLAEIKIAN